MESRHNENTPEYLNNILETITENLRESEIRPSLAFHNAPKNFLIEEDLEWRVIPDEDDSFEDSVCRDVLYKNWVIRRKDICMNKKNKTSHQPIFIYFERGKESVF